MGNPRKTGWEENYVFAFEHQVFYRKVNNIYIFTFAFCLFIVQATQIEEMIKSQKQILFQMKQILQLINLLTDRTILGRHVCVYLRCHWRWISFISAYENIFWMWGLRVANCVKVTIDMVSSQTFYEDGTSEKGLG